MLTVLLSDGCLGSRHLIARASAGQGCDIDDRPATLEVLRGSLRTEKRPLRLTAMTWSESALDNSAARRLALAPSCSREWVQGDHLAFSKNANYWQTGHPHIDELRVQIFRDAAAMVTQLEGGALDVIDTPSLQDFVRLKSDARFQALPHTSKTRFLEIGASPYAPPLDSQKLRQALNYALDRDRLRARHCWESARRNPCRGARLRRHMKLPSRTSMRSTLQGPRR